MLVLTERKPTFAAFSLYLNQTNKRMNFLTKTIFVGLLAFISIQLSAQKFGYVNSAQLIEMHPKTKTANAELEAFQKKEAGDLQSKASVFDEKYKKFVADYQSESLSPKQVAELEKALGEEQQGLQKLEQEAQLRLAQKREALIQPILKELDDAIQSIGQEGSYLFIFDTSGNGSIIYAEESEDITDQVKSKLGW